MAAATCRTHRPASRSTPHIRSYFHVYLANVIRQRETERDVVPHADRIDDRRLRLGRHLLTQLVHVVPLDRHVVDQDLARRRAEQPRHQLQHR